MEALLDKQHSADGDLVVDTQEYAVEDYEVDSTRLSTVAAEPRIGTVNLENRIANG
jgi:hypothetical protein